MALRPQRVSAKSFSSLTTDWIVSSFIKDREYSTTCSYRIVPSKKSSRKLNLVTGIFSGAKLSRGFDRLTYLYTDSLIDHTNHTKVENGSVVPGTRSNSVRVR